MVAKSFSLRRSALLDPRFFPVILVGVVLLVYCNSFGGSFVFDDREMIIRDEQVHQPLRYWSAILLRTRPLVTYSLALNYALGGLNPWGYHALNLAVHVFAALVLYDLIRRSLLLDLFADRYRETAPVLALAASLLWAIHPLQTESVTYIVQRAESLMGLFYLLTLYCLLRGASSRSHGNRWYATTVVACALGMASKEVMCTAPLVALMYDRVFLSSSFAEILRKRWALYAGLASTWLILAVPLRGAVAGTGEIAGAGPAAGFTLKVLTPAAYLASQPGVVLHYLRLALWPSPLCLDYDWPMARGVAAILIPGALVVTLCLLSAWALWLRPALGFLGACFFIVLAPTSSFLPIGDLAAEHRMYLPLAAVMLLIVLSGYSLVTAKLAGPERKPIASPSIAILALLGVTLLFAWMTASRNRDYFSEEALWRSVVEVRPDNMRARQNLGILCLDAGKLSEAAEHFQVLAQRQPDAQAHYLLATTLERLGRTADAVAHYLEVVRLQPESAKAHFDLANALASEGQLVQALVHYREVVKLKPDHALGYNNLAMILANQGKNDEAITFYREALRLNPGLAIAHNNLGLALARLGRYDEAVEQYRQALAIDPAYVNACNNWGTALLKQGQFAEAESLYRRALDMDSRSASSSYNLAQALKGQGKDQEARQGYRQALALDSSWPERAARAAWQLATDPIRRDGAEAVRLAEQACQATETTAPRMLDVLAASHAAAGHFGEAESIGRQARSIAIQASQPELARAIEERIRLYAEHQAFSEAARKSPSS
jgi:tetratricopeptide (TPR) repeat protein